MKKHKTLGQVFTPTWIVKEILDSVGYNSRYILDKYIMEPASGDGVFLLEIVKRYIDICIDNKISSEEIQQRLEKYIYAVEIDELEHNKSIMALDCLVFEKICPKRTTNWNIHNKNTLDFYKECTQKFDFVVGNPPYIRIHNLDVSIRDTMKNNFVFTDGTIDIYLTFFEMGINMLTENGKLGYITPNSFLHNSSYGSFREYLKNKKKIRSITDFKSNKIFDGYSTYTAITILDNQHADNYFNYRELENNTISDICKVKFENLSYKDWSFANENDTTFLSNLNTNKNSSIKDFFDVQYGFATMRDKIFISKIKEYNNELVYFNESLVERGILRKVIKGSKFKGVFNHSDMILFPYKLVDNRHIPLQESELQKIFPHAYKYLLHNKVELESRDIDSKTLWYEFGRSQGLQNIHNEKIVLSTLVNGKIEYYKVPSDVLMYSGIFIVKNKNFSDWSIIEDTLKSSEFYKYIRLTGKDFSGGYKSITSKQIKEFQINTHNPQSLF